MASHPLVIGVTDLLHRPATRRTLERDVVLGGLEISSAAVPDGGPVSVDLELEAVGADIVVYGNVRAPFVGECRRCLGEVRGEAVADVREVYARHPAEGETYALEGEHVDLEPLVRDAVLLALPLAPLCSPECRGPAPQEFPATVAEDAVPEPAGEGADRPVDPRWAALDQLDLE